MAEPGKEQEPIDVEFSPAEPADEKPSAIAQATGPGWIAIISVGAVAALVGGAIGVVAGGTGGRYAQASEVAVDISKLEDADRSLSEDLDVLKEDVREAKVRLQSASEAILADVEDDEALFQKIDQDLTDLRAYYRALLGDVEASEVSEDAETGTDETAEDSPEGGETVEVPETLPDPGVTLANLQARLAAMETIDQSGAATPRQLSRSVEALERRASELEAVDVRLSTVIEERTALLRTLEVEFDTLSDRVGSLVTSLQTQSENLESGQAADKTAIDTLVAELEGLRGLVNERLSNLEDAQLSVDEEALVRRADQILSLSALETALRTGEGFETELEALAIQLPTNSRLTALRNVAKPGAPTIDQLKIELVSLADEIRTVGMPDTPTGQWAWVGEILSSVVTVREEGTASGETASKRVSTAITFLDSGDLPSAITELKPIDGAQGDLLKDWIEGAERRVRADSLIERLRADVLSKEINE